MEQEMPPSKGYNVKYELEKFAENPNLFLEALTNLPPNSHEMTLVGKPDAESIRSIIKKIIEKLNDYACLPEIEYQNLLSDINQMAFDKMQENAQPDKIESPDDEAERESDFVSDLTSSPETLKLRQERWISTAAQIANHSRLGCRYCLNDDCPKKK
jgi:hypothetical protein